MKKLDWFQCIVITVGDGDFSTEYDFDFAIFKDSDSDSGIKHQLISRHNQKNKYFQQLSFYYFEYNLDEFI